jgi:hypothetical protein
MDQRSFIDITGWRSGALALLFDVFVPTCGGEDDEVEEAVRKSYILTRPSNHPEAKTCGDDPHAEACTGAWEIPYTAEEGRLSKEVARSV